MNIGFVTEALPYVPSPGGFRLYAANLIRCLSRRHSIHLVSVLRNGDAGHVEWARGFCESVTTVPLQQYSAITRVANVSSGFVRGQLLTGRQRLLQAVDKSSSAGKWEVMHVEGAATGSMVSGNGRLPNVLSIHGSGTLRCSEMLKCAQSRWEHLYNMWLSHFLPRFERLVFPRYGAVTVVAKPDLDEVRKVVTNADVRLISFGTDTDYFRPVEVAKQPATLVFHAHLSYSPNIEAALEFANEVFPRIRKKVPNAAFHLVVAKPAAKIMELASRPGITISADVPDVRPEVCAAQVYVCPVRYGAGLKNKMLEAMAMRMPIVAYPGATVGLDCTPGKHVMEARTPDEFARYAVDLLQNPRRAEELASAAYHFVKERFSWDARAREYEDLYREVIRRQKQCVSVVVGNVIVACN
ncbi:MAG: glycosyltransferase [Candidatus Korobacteraceae bacterium]